MSGKLKLSALLVGAVIAGGLLALPGSGEPTRLTFLSVGQGDCAVFQTAGHTILIDVGPNVRGNDAGKRIVVPDLHALGVDAIDLALLSHPDMDHIGGLGAVLKSFPTGKVAMSSGFSHDRALLDHLAQMDCPMNEMAWLGPGQSAQVGDFKIEVDCPSWHEGEPDNDGSEFVKISGDGASAVFTGDASASTESKMMRGHDWHAQILKLGHHGSHTASSESWLEDVHPQWAIVSCGRNNSYGHPHHDVLERVKRLGIQLARTDQEGDITFLLGPQGWVRQK